MVWSLNFGVHWIFLYLFILLYSLFILLIIYSLISILLHTFLVGSYYEDYYIQHSCLFSNTHTSTDTYILTHHLLLSCISARIFSSLLFHLRFYMQNKCQPFIWRCSNFRLDVFTPLGIFNFSWRFYLGVEMHNSAESLRCW